MICTICARLGSKGVPNKNIRLFAGLPLIVHSIEQAFASCLFEHIVVSTDSPDIAHVAQDAGAEVWFLRPKELAMDSTPKILAIRHAFQQSEQYYSKQFDVHVDIDATSPLRMASDIRGAYDVLINENADVVLTGSPARKNPYFNMVEVLDAVPKMVKALEYPIACRQDAPKVYDLNASIYIWKRDALMNNDSLFTEKTRLYCMPEERSLDIDTELDFRIAETIMLSRNELETVS